MDLDTASSSEAAGSDAGSQSPSFEIQDALLDESTVENRRSTPAADEPSSEEEDNDDDDEDSSDDPDVAGLTRPEREILTLLAVDKKLASVLQLAATALSSLDPHEAGKLAESEHKSQLEAFIAHTGEYYKAMDDIQLTLRSSIHALRQTKISPRTLADNPAMGSVMRGTTVAPGTLPQGDGLGKGATRMQTEAMKDIVEALEAIRDTKRRKQAAEEP